MSFLPSIPTFVRWLRDALQGLPSSSSPGATTTTNGVIVEEFNKLGRTYSMIMEVLQDAEQREIRDHSMKLWLNHLKELSYDADDLLSEYQYELSRCQIQERDAAAEATTKISGKRKNVGDDQAIITVTQACKVSTASSFSPGDMLERIKNIRLRLDEIDRDRERFSLRHLGPRRYDHNESPQPTSSFVDQSGVLGRDADKEKLVELLFSDMDEKISVIPIVGMGGLGKTTLARVVYNDPRVSQHFDSRAWVCVSDGFNVTRLTKAIIESLTKEKYEGSYELDNLQHELHYSMQSRKVLLVLDDVWNDRQTEWDSLRAPFSSVEFLRIIVTTRNDSVAEVMQTGIPIYRPCGLSEEHSWLLFKQCAFGAQCSIEEIDPFLADVGRQIAKKCDGLPLALTVIGGVVRFETDESEWLDVLQSEIWEMEETEAEILPVLKLSYSRMPSYLKPCFLLCSMFPKDHPLDIDIVIPLWIANGYIQCRANKTAEDTGRGYFDELCERSFFQLCQFDQYDYVMHDMIHDLARSITGKECCAIVSGDNLDKSIAISNKVRHLYADIRFDKDLRQILQRKEPTHLRTLVYYDRCVDDVESIDIFNKFLGLRALILCPDELEVLTPSNSVLKHLRYLLMDGRNLKRFSEAIWSAYNLQRLDMPCTNVKISRKISNLVNLQSLNYDSEHYRWHGPECPQSLPQELTRLVNLQSLLFSSESPMLPPGIGNLSNLHTVSSFTVGIDKKHSGIAELKTLVNLRGDLKISSLENVISADDAKTANLSNKSRLENLTLEWSADPAASDEVLDVAVLENLRPHTNFMRLSITGYRGHRLPSWLGDPSFSRLISIQLLNCYKLQDFGMLCQLPSLKLLDVKNPSLVLEDVYRPSLNKPLIETMPSWDHVRDATLQHQEQEYFPSLSSISIERCHMLWRLPSFQQLVSLTLGSCNNLTSITVHHDATAPSKLRSLSLHFCAKLELIKGLRFLTSLESLQLIVCPQLRIPIDDCLPVMPSIRIVICDGDDGDSPKHWCASHGHHYNPVSPPGSSGLR